ncbi:GMC family oxidoreductase [Paraburkholderia acidicola]|uniref:GMC family oxidoreductase n=1 Tax=Paraburkholderia acidicola TaxID=1912599 RepID=A0ABV1LUH3_9BURK
MKRQTLPRGRRDFLAKLIALGASAAGPGLSATYAAAALASQGAPIADSHDYVIVGAGSAGCLLADRLSATGASVLLIEAGSNLIEQPKISQVADWAQNLGSDTDWARKSVPQPGFANRAETLSAGKVWGGSGSINGMIWQRADPRDYLQWHRLVGDPWRPEALNRAYLDVVQPTGHTGGAAAGRLTIGRYADAHPLTGAFLAASMQTGLRAIDLSAGLALDGVGVSYVNATPDGHRSAPAEAMLAPALVRPNLDVITGALVTRLVMRGTHCHGVELVVDGERVTCSANRETIVCAGACESPRILMLSGIGPIDQLAPHNIQVRQALPAVGRNLHDHLLLRFVFKAKTAVPPPVSNGFSTMAFYGMSGQQYAPDIQVIGMQYPYGTDVPAGAGYTVKPFLVKPRSRGAISLTSADPLAPLAIDPRYLEEAIDRDNVIAGVERSIDIGSGMHEFYGSLVPDVPLRSRADKLAFITANAAPGMHYAGTCAAGRDPATSVVDSHFRVWGVEGLRVVDASVIPEVPAVNAHAPVLTIAQLAASYCQLVP